MKKFLLFAFVFLLGFSPASARFFPDVAFDHPYFEAISTLEERAVLQGFQDGSFGPDRNISRAAALKVVLLGSGMTITGTTAERPFPDVPTNEWFAPIVKKGRDLGIVQGDSEGNFVPAREVSRAEALAMLFRTNGDTLEMPTDKPFDDVSLDAWYAPHFAAAKQTGLLTGKNGDPNRFLTRAELSDLVFRFFKNEWSSSTFAGKASFYGDGLDGNKTASGEIFSNTDFVAAHRTLAFDTKVRVTSTEDQKSVVVRVVDRGPYVKGRVIDLSKTAFSALAPTSRGVIPVSLEVVSDDTPLGPSEKCISAKTSKISKTFFENIELLHEIPTTVRLGEQIWIEGRVKLQNPPDEIHIFANGETFSVPLISNIFRFPVVFDTTAKFAVFFGNEVTGQFPEISVVAPKCEAENTENPSAPSALSFFVRNGETKFVWSTNENNLFRLEFSQGEKSRSFFVFGKNEFVALPSDFSGFSEGIARVKIWGAQATGSLNQTTDWAFGGEEVLALVNHISLTGNRLTPDFPATFEIGEKIVVSGTTTKKLSDKMILLDSDGVFSEVPLTQDTNGDYRAEFVPTTRGNYTIEINDSGGLALFIGGISPVGSAPIIPDYFDKNPVSDSISADEYAEKMREWINTARVIAGASRLTPDTNLMDLAQFRADDMCDHHYLAHTDANGKTASDWRVAFNVKTAIGENIAKNSDLRAAHEFLMRSPGHRENLLSSSWSRVGLGFCEEDDDLIVVEIFGTEPFDKNEIEAWREKFLTKINAVRTPDPIVPKARIEAVAQKWAQKMSDENFLGFTRGDESLEKMLTESGITASAKVIVLQITALDELLAEIDQPKIVFDEYTQDNFLLEHRFQNFGIGISQGEDWLISVVLLGTEEE